MLYATHAEDEAWSILITISTIAVYLFVCVAHFSLPFVHFVSMDTLIIAHIRSIRTNRAAAPRLASSLKK